MRVDITMAKNVNRQEISVTYDSHTGTNKIEISTALWTALWNVNRMEEFLNCLVNQSEESREVVKERHKCMACRQTKEKSHKVDGLNYCEDCFYEMFDYCEGCKKPFELGDLFMVDTGTGHACNDCVDEIEEKEKAEE